MAIPKVDEIREALRARAKTMEAWADEADALAAKLSEAHWRQRLTRASQKMRDAAIETKQAAR